MTRSSPSGPYGAEITPEGQPFTHRNHPMTDTLQTSKLDEFRAYVAEAERLEAEKVAATDADATVAALRAEIENCEDEAAAVKLIKRLSEAEITAKVKSIRAAKLAVDCEAAWRAAHDLVIHAVGDAGDAVGDAVGRSFDNVWEINRALLSPEAVTLAKSHPSINHRIDHGIDAVSSSALGVGPANLIQAELLQCRSRDHYQGIDLFCRTALQTIDRAFSAIPEIKRQAAKMAKIHAAVMAAAE